MRLALALVLAWLAPSTALACTASASGTFSYEVTVSPLAGMRCMHTVTVFDGASCAGAPVGSADLACNFTSRLAIRDDGALVSILAPRTSRRSWNIVRVFRVGDAGETGYLRLDDVPATSALRGSVRVTFDGAAVIFEDRRQRVSIPFSELTPG